MNMNDKLQQELNALFNDLQPFMERLSKVQKLFNEYVEAESVDAFEGEKAEAQKGDLNLSGSNFKFGTRSKQELVGVHPTLKRVVRGALHVSTQDFGVYDGLRTLQEQRDYVEQGVSHTMNSLHLRQDSGYSHAVDLVPWVEVVDEEGNLKGQYRWEHALCYKIAVAMYYAWQKQPASTHRTFEMRWGNCWDLTFREYALHTVKDAQIVTRGYTERRLADGKEAFLDAVHFEIVHR